MDRAIAIWRESPPRSRRALVTLALLLALLPLVADRYLLTTMILVLTLAYVGQAWNIMMGFAGQLSLGNALYVGLGAYTAAALFQFFAVSPWLGMLAAVAVCVLAATAIGWLAFRFGISGTYFALLTIAFAEFTRIGFENFPWIGGAAGFFIRVAQDGRPDWLNLRGGPLMFYYVALALAVLGFVVATWVLHGRAGYYFRAIRDNEEAARAAGIDTFRYKLFAVQISGGLTALAGVFYAFYYSNLFPDQIFNISRSIEIVLVPIIGGIGTLFGPLLGAAILTLLSESLNAVLRSVGVDVPGVKQVLYGVVLGGTIMFMPNGVWPGIAKRLGFERRTRIRGAHPMLEVAGVSKHFRGLKAVSEASLHVDRGEIVALIGPNGAGKTTLFNLIAGVYPPSSGRIVFEGRDIAGLRPDRACNAGIGRTFQIVKPFADMTVVENAMVGGFRGTRDTDVARSRAEAALRSLGMWALRDRIAAGLTLPDRKRLEVARALATQPKLLLLDEVMAGLRPTETDEMVRIFRRLNAEHGTTILLIEHVMRAVMALAQRVYVLHHGEIIAHGTPQEVTRDPRVLESYLGADAIA